MNKPDSASSSGRILRHGHQADEVTTEAIERRARELAQIDGRSPDLIDDEDLRRSRAELSGDTLPPSTLSDAETNAGLSRDPSEPPSDTGTQIPSLNEPEDQRVTERLVLEGVDEAQHDQMLAASRLRRREEHP